MTQHYIGVKQVQAWPQEKDGQPGYAVKYPDGYISWSPKATFEAAYLPMGEGNDGSFITQKMVDDFISRIEHGKMGAASTVVCATLRNGFTVIKDSSCVDPDNYNHGLGVTMALKKVKEDVWKLLGFLLASARHGLKPVTEGRFQADESVSYKDVAPPAGSPAGTLTGATLDENAGVP